MTGVLCTVCGAQVYIFFTNYVDLQCSKYAVWCSNHVCKLGSSDKWRDDGHPKTLLSLHMHGYVDSWFPDKAFFTPPADDLIYTYVP